MEHDSYPCPDHLDQLVHFSIEGEEVDITAECPECERLFVVPPDGRPRIRIKRTSPIEARLRAAVRRYSCKTGMSMRALAKSSGVPRQTISRWIHGSATMHLSRAAAVAEAVGYQLRLEVRP